MLKEFRLPDLGEGLTESEIVSWRIAAGDHVTLNQIIADVETAKAVVELPSPVDGVVQALHADPGDTVEVGTTIVTFELDDPVGGRAAAEPPPGGRVAAEPRIDTPDTPQPNLVGYGAGPERAGRPKRRPRTDVAADVAPRPVAPADRGERPRSTPPVRHLAEQLGVDLARLTGTGANGLITRDDVLAAVDGTGQAPTAMVGRPAPGTFTTWNADGAAASDTHPVRRVPIKGVRKHTAAAMVQSAFTAPHATCFLTVDVTPTLELIDRLAATAGDGRRVGLLAILSRAFLVALRSHPELNSRWDDAAGEIATFGYVNLGIAAATDRGLVVPHIRDAHAMTVAELAAALRELTDEARAGTTPPEKLTGSTITISNLGVFGVDAGTPILNPGEAAILAVGAVQRRPWEYRGELALRSTLTLSLSFDHRVVDGAEASRFLAELGGLLADPGLALLRDAGTGPLF
ncbi:MAG TPA: dihydrolipoamide acetyltransferase family protein [Pseudolysinimonas sp.]|nr:dihydrolipoamide acetyltransferase family protein [Pseudolysinimonas sp.]